MEKCDIDADIQKFIEIKGTGDYNTGTFHFIANTVVSNPKVTVNPELLGLPLGGAPSYAGNIPNKMPLQNLNYPPFQPQVPMQPNYYGQQPIWNDGRAFNQQGMINTPMGPMPAQEYYDTSYSNPMPTNPYRTTVNMPTNQGAMGGGGASKTVVNVPVTDFNAQRQESQYYGAGGTHSLVNVPTGRYPMNVGPNNRPFTAMATSNTSGLPGAPMTPMGNNNNFATNAGVGGNYDNSMSPQQNQANFESIPQNSPALPLKVEQTVSLEDEMMPILAKKPQVESERPLSYPSQNSPFQPGRVPSASPAGSANNIMEQNNSINNEGIGSFQPNNNSAQKEEQFSVGGGGGIPSKMAAVAMEVSTERDSIDVPGGRKVLYYGKSCHTLTWC